MGSRRARILAGGDLAALLAFAVIGLVSHDRGVGLDGLARDWLPLAACYAAVAIAIRTWTRPRSATFFFAWLCGITGGVILRALALGREPDGDQAQFLVVTLAVTLGLLGGWRALESVVRSRAAKVA
jgi:hypothetical protein